MTARRASAQGRATGAPRTRPATAVDGNPVADGALAPPAARAAIQHRLRRAEGQLRGIQRMIDEGADCLAVASQLGAVRRALDSTSEQLALCVIEQELSRPRVHAPEAGAAADPSVAPVIERLEGLLARLR
ncbi:MAG: metal-sensing transcriptional repressor [Ideonella sp.]|nr:metal-sensing transcriptional repressor [Ideonella sp.]